MLLLCLACCTLQHAARRVVVPAALSSPAALVGPCRLDQSRWVQTFGRAPMMRHARARVFRTALQILLAELGDGNFLDIALGDRMMLAMMSMVLGPLPASSGACLHCCEHAGIWRDIV